MFTIAICDDDERVRDFIQDCANDFFSVSGTQYNFILCQNGDELLKRLSSMENPISILFLDIEMPGETGIEIKNSLQNNSAVEKIVFITSHTEAMQQAFGLKVVGFMNKPLEKKLVIEWISNIYTEFSSREGISFGDRFYQYDDILYIKSDGNYLVAKLSNGKETSSERMGITSFIKVLDNRFVRIHRSYIVNLSHVQRIKYNEICIDNDEALPLGRSFSEDVKNKYDDYVLAKVKGRMGW
ncbi:DNA-binding response regulator [Butyrivibrio sp. XB500-5]|uniref:LytR/AlgR family response regulator transcription factor n=1 Tax=Butyrivibrio sp. XB500-5 TaxID=2364880 RepID=UPI000EA8AF9A|nr:LytTR family DNA-binding domain-containing protein [Butyrivibrio sp. XB500-5]RKM63306.1 DNA-binding response regulator [Butyrivibrio sp. XB500-5]